MPDLFFSSPSEAPCPRAVGTSTGTSTGTTWWAVHLFLDPPGERRADPDSRSRADRLLREIVAPSVEALARREAIRRYFFIRYNELGAHVRLRLEPTSPDAVDEIRAWLDERLEATGEAGEDEHGEWLRCGHEALDHRRILPYEPETIRYGGEHGVDLAEDFFAASSELVLRLLAEPIDEGARSARAILAMVVLLHALAEDREHAVELAADYSRLGLNLSRSTNPNLAALDDAEALQATFETSYARQAPALAPKVEALWSALDSGSAIPEPWSRYRDAVTVGTDRMRQCFSSRCLFHLGRPVESRREAARMLAPSYLHMGNNRLGIYVFEEAYLGHLTSLLLAEIGAPSTTTPEKGD